MAQGRASSNQHDNDRFFVSGERFESVDFRGSRWSQFTAVGSKFEQCLFDGMAVESANFGAGRAMSEYVNCSFEDARIRMFGGGGYARFENCSFENAQIRDWFCYTVELVGCSFSGILQSAMFNGTVPLEKREMLGDQ